ncbi:hypothetical protein Tco_0155280 [Tanacetum coccineum]
MVVRLWRVVGMAWDGSGGGVGCGDGSGGRPEAAPDSWPEKEKGKMGARCLSGLRGLHYLLDKVVQVGMYRDLSLRTSGSLHDPTTATITTITITNDDGIWRVMIFQETISTV